MAYITKIWIASFIQNEINESWQVFCAQIIMGNVPELLWIYVEASMLSCKPSATIVAKPHIIALISKDVWYISVGSINSEEIHITKHTMHK